MRSHHLKTWPVFFQAIRDGDKGFDVREDDRGFMVGDELVLEEFTGGPPATSATDIEAHRGQYTGLIEIRRVGYILRGFPGLKPGWVVLGFENADRAEVKRLTARLNTPEVDGFVVGVVSEAQHQRERWSAEHDAGKMPEDWFWLIGYLAGKALASAIVGNAAKAKHHVIATAAALANWHAALNGGNREMRPGIGVESRP